MCLPCPPSIFYNRFYFRLIVCFRFEAPVVRSNSAGIYNLWNQNICDYSLKPPTKNYFLYGVCFCSSNGYNFFG